MTLDNLPEPTCGATSPMQKRTEDETLAHALLQCWTPVLSLFVAAFLFGVTAGLLLTIPTHRIVLTCGYVAWLVASILSCVWLESRVRTGLEERERQARVGWISEAVIHQFINKHIP